MALKSMKLPKSKGKEGKVVDTAPANPGGPEYPWGLRINLEKDQLKKFPGLKSGRIDEALKIIATAKISSINKSENLNGDDNFSMGIQITELDILSDSDFDNAFEDAEKE